MPELVDAAIWYALRMNWAVLPLHTPNEDGSCSCGRVCNSVGKHPRTDNGVHDATTNKAQIRKWWALWPDANIGIATGKLSGIVVIDVDPRNGGDKTLRRFEREYGKTTTPVMVDTGGGGTHYYFRYIEGRTTIYKPGPGIEIKSDGGYVVAPPSLHSSGSRYTRHR